MKAILEFDLPDEKTEHHAAVFGQDAISVLWDLDQWLRGKIKHENEFKTIDDALQAARDRLREDCMDRGVVLDVY